MARVHWIGAKKDVTMMREERMGSAMWRHCVGEEWGSQVPLGIRGVELEHGVNGHNRQE